MNNLAEWRPQGMVDQNTARSVEYLQQHLDLPDGVELQTRPSAYKNASVDYALVTTESKQDIVTFRLDAFFHARLIPLLKQAVHKALKDALETGETQYARFRDPNAE